MLRVLAADGQGHAAGAGAVGIEAVDPLSGGGLVEVAAADDQRLFGLPQFYLHAEALAHAHVVRQGVGGEHQVHVERAVLHLGHYLRHAQRVAPSLVGDGGGQAGGDAVYVVFAQGGVYLVLVQHLHLGNVFGGGHLLPGHHLDEAQLPVRGGCHHQAVQASAGTLVLLAFALAVVAQEVAADEVDGRVVAQALAFQAGGLQLEAVFGFGHFQLGLALDAHGIFLLVQAEGLAQALQFVLRLQGLLPEGDALLFHLDFFLPVGEELLLPLVALVLDVAQQFGIVQHEDGVALAQEAAFFGHDALHAARLAGVDQDGEDGLDKAFHVDVFQELVVLHFADLDVFQRDAQAARTQGEDDDVDEQSGEGGSAQEVVTVPDVPGFLFQLYVHDDNG